MKHVVDALSVLVLIVSWLAGVVLAQGLELKAAAAVFPPYGWYLLVERAMVALGVVA